MTRTRVVLTGLLVLLPVAVGAEVKQVASDGFLVEHRFTIDVPPPQAWQSLVHPERWWPDDHTWSGSRANLSLEPRAGGCFCEAWTVGSAEHARVVMAIDHETLRMRGSLGPLQAMALTGVLTVSLTAKDGGTEAAISYRVGGDSLHALNDFASVVDRVIGLQFGAFAAHARGGGSLDPMVWVLTEYGPAGSTKAPLEGTRVDVTLENGRIAGSSGCNSLTGSYTHDGTSFRVGPVASTRKACPPPVMQQEDEVLRILQAVESLRVAGDRLTLSGPAGALTFVSEGEPSLVGSWEMTGYNNGKQAVVSKKIGTIVTTTWESDGRVSGFGGCNNYSGSYELNGTAIRFGLLTATLKACVDPEVLSQEQLFLEALQASTRIEIRGDTLWLRDEAGATQATFTRRRP